MARASSTSAPLTGRQLAGAAVGEVADAAARDRVLSGGSRPRRARPGWPAQRATGAARPGSPRGPSATFSATVMESNSSMRWNVRPRPARPPGAGDEAVEPPVAEVHRPSAAVDQTGAGVERRGLAGAVRSDQPGDGAGRRMEVTPSTATRPPKRTVKPSTRRSGLAVTVPRPRGRAQARRGRSGGSGRPAAPTGGCRASGPVRPARADGAGEGGGAEEHGHPLHQGRVGEVRRHHHVSGSGDDPREQRSPAGHGEDGK